MSSDTSTARSIQELRESLREIRVVDDLLRTWEGHSTHSTPVVAVVGMYNAGKSALIKRLLIEADLAIPEWLTVSGRPETFETNDVEVAGCILRDIPGMGGGNGDHEQKAADALLTADVVLQVLMPQLVAGRLESITDVWSGRIFHPNGWAYPTEGLQVAIGRVDEIVDPDDDLEEFHRRLDAKKAEVVAMMRRHGVNWSKDDVMVVAADPHGEVGNRRDVSKTEYAEGRTWDGVDVLTGRLRGLAHDFATLRIAAEERFVVGVATQAVRALEEEIDFESGRLNRLENEQKRRDSALERVAAIEAAARQTLIHTVEEAVTAVSRGGAAGAGFVQRAKERLSEDLERWRGGVNRDCESLADELQVQFDAQRQRPGMRPMEDVEAAVAAGASKTEDPVKLDKYVSVAETVRQGVLAGVSAWHGDRFQKIRDGAAKGGASGLKKLFRSNTDKWLEKVAKADTVLTQVGPALSVLGTLVLTEINDSQEARRREQQRAELRVQVEAAAKKLGALFFDGDPATDDKGVVGDLGEFREAIRAAYPRDDEVKEAVRQRDRVVAKHNLVRQLLLAARS